MQPLPCVFPDLVPWAQAAASVPPFSAPLVLTDFTSPGFDPSALARTARALADSCDAVLVGEHQNRPDFPPTLLADLLLRAGVTPWPTLACRDRNRIVLEQELRGLLKTGVDTVLCVTGDGRAYDVRADVTQVFDLDSMRLAALAADLGLSAAVAETPAARPVSLRPARLVEKQRAGASVAVLNHCRRPGDVETFVRSARACGLQIPVIASVAVYTDDLSAAVLQALPGLELDRDAVRTVLGSADPRRAGIEAALVEALTLLDIEGVAGVNVSGLASAAGFLAAAEVKADVGRRIREAL